MAFGLQGNNVMVFAEYEIDVAFSKKLNFKMQVFVFLLKIVTFSSCVRTQGYKIFTRRSKLKENKVAEIHRNLY